MSTIITYDIPTKHLEFKKLMHDLGYKGAIPGENCKIISLPNTTLYHQFKDGETARKDAQAICKKINVELERCIASKWTGWSAICGEPFK